MTDLEIYRARIGLNNLRKCGGNKNNTNPKCCRNMSPLFWKILFIFALGSFSLCMTSVLDVSSGILMESFRTSHLYLRLQREINGSLNLSPSTLMEQNYQLKACEWNSYMKALNGNKNSIEVAHWNGGSSHLGKSSKGKEKLHHVKFLLSKYNLDVLGLSEANLHKSVNNLEYKIDKYKVYHQDLNIARIVTYVREDLDCKIEKSLMDPNIACIWLWIGRGKSRWLVGQVYREHMVLGDKESSSCESQIDRWRKFLEKVRQTERFENVVIMGDVNINLDPDSIETSPLHNVLRDDLLDTFPLAGFKQTVTKCTRQIKDQVPSLIDQSWVKNMNKHVQTSSHDTDSDHDMVVTTLKVKGCVRNEETVVRRNFSRFNLEEYKTEYWV